MRVGRVMHDSQLVRLCLVAPNTREFPTIFNWISVDWLQSLGGKPGSARFLYWPTRPAAAIAQFRNSKMAATRQIYRSLLTNLDSSCISNVNFARKFKVESCRCTMTIMV